MIRLVIFDLYNTLIDLSAVNRDELDKNSWQILVNKGYNLNYDDFIKISHDTYEKWRKFRVDNEIDINPRIWWQEIFWKLKIPGKIKLIEEILKGRYKLQQSKIKLYPDVNNTLNYLRNNNIKVGLLTNSSDGMVARNDLVFFKIDKFFDLVLISSEFIGRKPNKKLFTSLLDLVPYTRDEILMVGDDYDKDIKPWIELNVKAILLKRDASSFSNSSIKSLKEIEKIVG